MPVPSYVYVRTEVAFLPFTSKIFSQPIPEILNFTQLFLRMALWKKKSTKLCVAPSPSTFGTNSTKNNFALIKNIFLQALVEIIFRYHYIFATKWKKMKFHTWSVGYQIWLKRMLGVYFWRIFWKIFSFTPSQSTPRSNKIFCFNKIILLQPLVEIISRYN